MAIDATIADHDKRRGIQKRRQGLHQCRIERLRFGDQMRSVYCSALPWSQTTCAREQAELVEVVGSPVHFGAKSGLEYPNVASRYGPVDGLNTAIGPEVRGRTMKYQDLGHHNDSFHLH